MILIVPRLLFDHSSAWYCNIFSFSQSLHYFYNSTGLDHLGFDTSKPEKSHKGKQKKNLAFEGNARHVIIFLNSPLDPKRNRKENSLF